MLRVRVAQAAAIAAAANLVASGAMLLWLRHGIPAGQDVLQLRREHIASHVAQWRAGWIIWHLAAIALIALIGSLALSWRDRAPIVAVVAIVIATAGLAADLAAEAILLGVIPQASVETFADLERTSDMLTGYLGNGLYSVAGLLVTWMGRRRLPAHLVALGGGAWACGLWLSAATLVASRSGQFASTAALMPLFIGWTTLLAWHFHRRSAA